MMDLVIVSDMQPIMHPLNWEKYKGYITSCDYLVAVNLLEVKVLCHWEYADVGINNSIAVTTVFMVLTGVR